MCVSGTRAVQQEILNRWSSSDLRVYAVWMPILRADRRSAITPDLLPDPRVQRYWDPDVWVGEYFRHLEDYEDHWDASFAIWDAYGLYGPSARWDDVEGLEHGAPLPATTTGWTIIAEFERLEAATELLLARPWLRIYLPMALHR